MAKLFKEGFKRYYNKGTLYNEEEVMLAAKEYIFCQHEFKTGKFEFDNFVCDFFDEESSAEGLIAESVVDICNKNPMFVYRFQSMLFRCLSKDIETFLPEMSCFFSKRVEEIRKFAQAHFADSRCTGYIIPIEECNCFLVLRYGIVQINNYALINRIHNISAAVSRKSRTFLSESSNTEEDHIWACISDSFTNCSRLTMYGPYSSLNLENFIPKDCLESLKKCESPFLYYTTTRHVPFSNIRLS